MPRLNAEENKKIYDIFLSGFNPLFFIRKLFYIIYIYPLLELITFFNQLILDKFANDEYQYIRFRRLGHSPWIDIKQ